MSYVLVSLSISIMDNFDKQMEGWSSRLQEELAISSSASMKVASTIYAEIVKKYEALQQSFLKSKSNVSFQDRIDELIAFQDWMDYSKQVYRPSVVRARVITQLYVCFVYLGDAMFFKLKDIMPSNALTHKCASYLISDRVRKFRHAIAHANWKYSVDYLGIEYWARGDNNKLEQFTVLQDELDFWQALSRCLAYTVVTAIKETRLN